MTAEGPKPFGTRGLRDREEGQGGLLQRAQHRRRTCRRTGNRERTRAEPEYRTPLLDYQQFPDTRNHGIYRAKTLKGIWATAPFLHNGSVPTLLRSAAPADKRPATFKLGTKEYDPVKLGYVVDGPRFLTPPGMQPFTYDTRLLGNWNTGHEWWFYPDLDDEMRFDIIEFLKTFDDANYPGDYSSSGRRTCRTMCRMRKALPRMEASRTSRGREMTAQLICSRTERAATRSAVPRPSVNHW